MSEAVVLIAASTAPATVKASATFVCDGVDDQVEINAALAVDDKRAISLFGLFQTTGPIVFKESGSSPILHDFFGASGQDQTQIIANHAGNAIEMHSVQTPQEWRSQLSNFLIRPGATKPARGISIQNVGFLSFDHVKVSGVGVGMYGNFCNTNTFDQVTVSDCGEGIHLTGTSGHASHFNAFRRCFVRNNDAGIVFEARAQMNQFEACTIETPSGKVGVQYVANAVEVDANGFDRCWFEGSGTPFSLLGGNGMWADHCRFAIPWTTPIVAQAGFNATGVKITNYLVDNPRSVAMSPQGVTFA